MSGPREVIPLEEVLIPALAADPSIEKAGLYLRERVLTNSDLSWKGTHWTKGDVVPTETLREVDALRHTTFREMFISERSRLREAILGSPFAERAQRIRALGAELERTRSELDSTSERIRGLQDKNRADMGREELRALEADQHAFVQLSRVLQDGLLRMDRISSHLEEAVPLEVGYGNVYDCAKFCYDQIKRCVSANLFPPGVLAADADERMESWLSGLSDKL